MPANLRIRYGSLPDQRQAIISNSGDLLSIGSSGTNFSEILVTIPKFSFKETAFANVVCKIAASMG